MDLAGKNNTVFLKLDINFHLVPERIMGYINRFILLKFRKVSDLRELVVIL